MDPLFTLLIAVVAVTPIAAFAGFVLGLKTRARMRGVETSLWRLERRVAGLATGPEVAEAKTEPSHPPEPEVAAPERRAAAAEAPQQPAEALPAASADKDVRPALAAPPQPAAQNLEERLGARWAVWVGGLALALGGIFMVRYSIERGLLGPGARIVLGALFALLLIAAGEWSRRAELKTAIAGLPSAHIPSILTAAGTVTAYATAYAAYALYGFLPAAAAFVVLGMIALVSLAAALLHGPALAALGMLGAFVAPLLVASQEPAYWPLYVYLAVVTASCFALASVRLWAWLALAAVAAGFLWTLPGIAETATSPLSAHTFHVVAGFVLVAIFLAPGFVLGPPAMPGRIDPVSTAGLVAYLLAATLLVLAQNHDGLPLFAFAALCAAVVAVAWRSEAAVGAVAAASLLAALVIADWAIDAKLFWLVAPGVPAAGLPLEPRTVAVGPHLTLGAAFAGLFGIAGFFAQGRSDRPLAPMLWATAAALAPIAILAALYYRVAGFDRSIPFGVIALALAALYAYATERLMPLAQRPGGASAAAIFATAATAALALAFTFVMAKGWLTVSLALMTLGAAYVASERPLSALRWLCAVLAVLVLARVVWEPRIAGDELGATPIFNWLLWGYGVPALAFWRAGVLLRRRADDAPSRIVDLLAILFTVLLATLEIRHFTHGGDIYAFGTGLGETGLQASALLAIAIGLERMREASLVYDLGARLAAGLALAIIVFGLGLEDNPLLTGEDVGGPVVNLILVGYGLPALLAAILALEIRRYRPESQRNLVAVTALVLVLAYVSLEVRRLFQGPVLLGETSEAECYTYSAVWLGLGVLLLIAGIALRSQVVRMASAAVIVLTVLKVFLSDLANLEGFLRAASFIGLGVVLMGIGWIYQRLLFPKPGAGAGVTPDPAPGS